MNFFTRYNKPIRSGISNMGISLAKQSFAKEADINVLVGRYIKGGALPSGDRQPGYGDYVGMDYQGIQNQIASVNQSFAELSADIRRKFSNDPAEMLSFLANPANQAEAVDLGLLPPPKEPEIDRNQPPSPTPAAVAPAPVSPPAPAPAGAVSTQ